MRLPKKHRLPMLLDSNAEDKYIHDMTIPAMVQDKYALTPKEERSGEL